MLLVFFFFWGVNRETGASCAIKEVDIIPDDPKSAECIKQLEQVIIICILLISLLQHSSVISPNEETSKFDPDDYIEIDLLGHLISGIWGWNLRLSFTSYGPNG